MMKNGNQNFTIHAIIFGFKNEILKRRTKFLPLAAASVKI